MAGGSCIWLTAGSCETAYIGAWGGLRLGAWDPPQAPRMKGGPMLILSIRVAASGQGRHPPNSSVFARLEADILIGQRESYR